MQIEEKPGKVIISRLRRNVRDYERRYEMSSADMLSAARNGTIRETAEVSRWMQALAVLSRVGQTRMAGTPSTTSASSTTKALRSTRS